MTGICRTYVCRDKEDIKDEESGQSGGDPHFTWHGWPLGLQETREKEDKVLSEWCRSVYVLITISISMFGLSLEYFWGGG